MTCLACLIATVLYSTGPATLSVERETRHHRANDSGERSSSTIACSSSDGMAR